MSYISDELVEKYGGTFRLTTLLIRRARELINDAPKLIETESKDPVEIAIEEMISGKLSFADKEVEVEEKKVEEKEA